MQFNLARLERIAADHGRPIQTQALTPAEIAIAAIPKDILADGNTPKRLQG